MPKTVRMRALETADGKGLFPLDVLDILEKFLNDPILYYPEINVANLKSKEKPENGHVFSPDIFCKIIYQRQIISKPVNKKMYILSIFISSPLSLYSPS